MSSLIKESGFDNILEYFEKNKHKPIEEWLEFVKIFKNNGKQGIVGLFSSKNTEKKMFFVFKLSQYINYLVNHEAAVMKSLNSISGYCPHFVKYIGNLISDIDPYKKKDYNPLEIKSKYTIEKEILLCEYVNNSKKFYNYIYSPKISEEILFSIVKQTLMALSISQKEKKFTHYDLHSNNIMIKKCSKDLVFLYVLDSNNQFYVHSKGYYPVIIDFGFSYSDDLKNYPMWGTLNQTDIGFLSDRFDMISDSKLFLVTVSDEIYNAKKTKKTKKLKNIVKNAFFHLNIDWYSGWDNYTNKSVTEYIFKKINKCLQFSNLFKEYKYYCIDIIQSLINCPLKPKKLNTKPDNKNSICLSFMTFLTEFVKIENQIGNFFNCLYILKNIVDIIRTVKNDYLGSNRQAAVGYFRLSLIERIDSIAKFCKLDDINFEKILCGLLCFANDIEPILYNQMQKIVKRKERDYKKLILHHPEEFFTTIDINIPDEYIFNEKTTILVIDNIKKECWQTKLDKEKTDYINDFHSISKGMELYKILQNIS